MIDGRRGRRSVDPSWPRSVDLSRPWSVASVELAAEEAPDTRFELFESSGHCLTVEEPERFNRVVDEFLPSVT